ncbi:MAG: hypothetical protein MJZ34_08265 [Paludibacteraceae bacterium]|nr:hypothetical protein [Paludibacteraceae bacterium]
MSISSIRKSCLVSSLLNSKREDVKTFIDEFRNHTYSNDGEEDLMFQMAQCYELRMLLGKDAIRNEAFLQSTNNDLMDVVNIIRKFVA